MIRFKITKVDYKCQVYITKISDIIQEGVYISLRILRRWLRGPGHSLAKARSEAYKFFNIERLHSDLG